MKKSNEVKIAGCAVEQQFADIAKLVKRTQNEVFRVANTALIDLYWQIGAYISASPTILHISSMRLPRRFGASAPTLLAMTDNEMAFLWLFLQPFCPISSMRLPRRFGASAPTLLAMTDKCVLEFVA